MEMQPGVCVIDLFGVSYDGILPSVVLPCDEIWFGLLRVHRQILPPWSPRLFRRGGIVFPFESCERVLLCLGRPDRPHLSVREAKHAANGMTHPKSQKAS